MSIDTVPGPTYRVQSRTNLVKGPWLDFGVSFPGTGDTLAIPVGNAASGEIYYRVRVQ